MPGRKTFVLVHGAWCGSWTWDFVVPLLEAEGHRVFAPTLTGLAERAHLLGAECTRGVHVQDICQLIDFYELADIVLVGHSYGGMVISEVAETAPDGTIGSIVYLDALTPPFPPPDMERAPIEVQIENGMITPWPAAHFGYDGQIAELWASKVTPMPAAALLAPLGVCPKAEAIPIKTYIWAEQSPNFEATFNAKSADPTWRARSMPARHCTMLDDPQGTAELLLEAAN